MAKYYDITSKITNELPTVKITDDLICTVNNRKSVILNVQAMMAEQERKAKESDEDDEANSYRMIEKALEMIIGKKNAKALEEMDLPLTEYMDVYRTVMAAAQGEEPEDTPM